jgi:hypothetical protein
VSDEAKSQALANYNKFLSVAWDGDAKFMNYLEGLQYAAACAQLVSQGRELTEEVLSSLLSSQAAVMTVRNAVRDEFIASMEMSRL